MTRNICKFLIVIAFLHIILIEVSASTRTKYNFNPQWKFWVGNPAAAETNAFDDSGWKQVTLPYAWNQEEAFKKSIHDLSTGIAWYRKHFVLPASDREKKVLIEFEGIRFGGEFYVNGKSIGIHENGVMAVGFDITDFLYFGDRENVIAVRTDNDWKYKERATGSTYQWNNDNFNANYGGIPKNVWLHVTNSVYQTLPIYSNLKTTGTYIYATDINIPNKTILLNAKTQIKNESGKKQQVKLTVEVTDLNGQVVSTFNGEQRQIKNQEMVELSAAQPLTNVEFWSWGYGYLYSVKTCLWVNGVLSDEVVTRTGFRKTAFKDGMFYLNDRVLQLKGYAQRTSNEWPAVGMSVPAWLSDYSNRLMVESNGNLVRWMHVTPWKQDVESCDRVGLIQAMPAGDAEKDSKGRQWEQRVELMRDAIVYNRNNPSIIFYEGGNESISEEHVADLKAIRDQYDPYGGRAIGSREMLDSKVAEYGGEMLYINKSAHIPMWAMEYSRDEGLRKYWDNYTPPYHKNGEGSKDYRSTVTNQNVKPTDASDYNRNQDTHAIENIIRWADYYVMRPGTGKRVSSGGVNIVFSDTNTHYRGAENYRRSGETDAMRIPKDNYWAHQVIWDGWVDIENHRTHIIGHWNYAPATVKDVFVVSPSDRVELFLNGKSQGMGKKSYQFLHTFKNITFEAGILKAVSLSAQGKKESEDIKITTGAPASLKLTLIDRPVPVKADGADMVLVQVEVVDAHGLRCPDNHPLVSFELNGPAEWLGGIGQGTDNYIMSSTLPAECGVNRALIRSTTQAGVVTIRATSEGLPATSLVFETIPFEVNHGLATVFPADGLPSNLSRGKTPSTPSYRVTRRSIDVKYATAGINSEQAYLSYDDNELSEWTNDGKISTGWITYTLAEKAIISEIELKLSGWRNRTYPIEILVDNQPIWKGETKQSLGYVTLPIQPTLGSTVTIRLTGTGSEKDAFQNMIEVNGNKELDGFKDPKNKDYTGQLRIIEAEFFNRLN